PARLRPGDLAPRAFRCRARLARLIAAGCHVLLASATSADSATERGDRPPKCERATVPSGDGKPEAVWLRARAFVLSAGRASRSSLCCVRVLSCRVLAGVRHAPVYATSLRTRDRCGG